MDIWVLKTDSEGSMQWLTIIDDDPNNRGEAIIQTSDGGYAIAGTGTDLQRNGPVPSIFRITSDGKAQQAIHLQNSPDYGSSIAEAPDNGYAVMSYSGFLSRVSETGTIIWSTRIGNDSDWYKTTRLADGGYVVGGDSRIAHVNDEGNILWVTQFSKDCSVDMVTANTAGDIFTGGVTADDVWVARLGADGKVVFNTTFGTSEPDTLYSIRSDSDGTSEIIYGSTVYRDEQPEERWISRTKLVFLSADGRRISEEPITISRIVTNTDQGGYAYAGFFVPEFEELQAQGYPGSQLRLLTIREDRTDREKSFDIGSSGPVSAIIQTDDGGFVIMGRE